MNKRAADILPNELISEKGLNLLVIAIQDEGENNVILTCHHSPRIESEGAVLLTRDKDELIKVKVKKST